MIALGFVEMESAMYSSEEKILTVAPVTVVISVAMGFANLKNGKLKQLAPKIVLQFVVITSVILFLAKLIRIVLQ
jgi:hypothetical protein